MNRSLAELRSAAEEFAEAGGKTTLNYFKQSFELEFKGDDSPVTNADREAEKVIRQMIRERYPDHGIIGEEFGSEREDSDVVWILDPIDGTQSFIHGVPFYTTLIGILVNNEPSVGVIYAPALGEMVSAAIGHGVTLNGKKTGVRSCEELSKATFLSTEVITFEQHGFSEAFSELLNRTRIHRTWGDAYGHLMVATGRADIMVDPILNIWDAAALLPIVTEAGGSYTDVNGNRSIETGNAISANKELIPEILTFFK
jgi:histidinol-phosphatase